MTIRGMEGLTVGELGLQLQAGGKFVVYQYCFSLIIATFKRSSAVHFLRADENAVMTGLRYTLLTLVLGWWGIPWGIIYSIQCLVTNLRSGKDVTAEVVAALSEARG